MKHFQHEFLQEHGFTKVLDIVVKIFSEALFTFTDYILWPQ